MAFTKFDANNERAQPPPPPQKPTGFTVSPVSYSISKNVVSALFLVIIPIPFFYRLQFSPEQTDLQSLTAIAGAICALCFSIPIFLKEVDLKNNFWQQFFAAGLLSFIGTVTGVLSFLLFAEGDQVTLVVRWFALFLLIAPVSISYLATDAVIKRLPKGRASSVPPRFQLVPSIAVTVLCMIATAAFSTGHPLLMGFVVSCLFSFFHVAIILVAIFIEVLSADKKAPGNETEIKKMIADLVNGNKSATTDEQWLMDQLRWHPDLTAQPEMVSRTKVLELVSEMDREMRPGMPAVTIVHYDKLIPRWHKSYDKLLVEANPHIVVIAGYQHTLYNTWSKLDDAVKFKIYHALAESADLSEELLKENNSLKQKYQFVKLYPERHPEYVVLADDAGIRWLSEEPNIYSYEDLLQYYEELKAMSLSDHDDRLASFVYSQVPFDRSFGQPLSEGYILKLISSHPKLTADKYHYLAFQNRVGMYDKHHGLFHLDLFDIYKNIIDHWLRNLVEDGKIKYEEKDFIRVYYT